MFQFRTGFIPPVLEITNKGFNSRDAYRMVAFRMALHLDDPIPRRPLKQLGEIANIPLTQLESLANDGKIDTKFACRLDEALFPGLNFRIFGPFEGFRKDSSLMTEIARVYDYMHDRLGDEFSKKDYIQQINNGLHRYQGQEFITPEEFNGTATPERIRYILEAISLVLCTHRRDMVHARKTEEVEVPQAQQAAAPIVQPNMDEAADSPTSPQAFASMVKDTTPLATEKTTAVETAINPGLPVRSTSRVSPARWLLQEIASLERLESGRGKKRKMTIKEALSGGGIDDIAWTDVEEQPRRDLRRAPLPRQQVNYKVVSPAAQRKGEKWNVPKVQLEMAKEILVSHKHCLSGAIQEYLRSAGISDISDLCQGEDLKRTYQIILEGALPTRREAKAMDDVIRQKATKVLAVDAPGVLALSAAADELNSHEKRWTEDFHRPAQPGDIDWVKLGVNIGADGRAR